MSNQPINKLQGWISIYRSIQDNELWLKEKFTKGQAWIDLLLLANFKDSEVLREYKNIVVKKGQFITSQTKLAKRWKWNRATVKKFLFFLKKEEMCSTTVYRAFEESFSLITIYNYNEYQENIPSSIPSRIPSNVRAVSINNKDNNLNKINNKRESTPLYLLNIPEEDMSILKEKINVSVVDIKRKGEELHNYCKAKGKIYKDYRALLRNALVKDFGYTFKN